MQTSSRLFIVSGPSGAGKTTVVNELIRAKSTQAPLERVVTYTSREPRQGEIEGVDYHFLQEHEFELRITQGFFCEWSKAYGNYYGSPATIFDPTKPTTSYILIVDRQGALKARSVFPEAVLIQITVPSLEIARQRLLNRGTDTNQAIDRRLALAQQEMHDDVENSVFHHKIFNVDLQKTLEALSQLIDAV